MADRYIIDTTKTLGHGAYGRIYHCKITDGFATYLRNNGVPIDTTTLEQLFAVKVQKYDPSFWHQVSLLREIDVLMRTKNYPGTVEVFDYWLGAETKQSFLILRLASHSLSDFVAREKSAYARVKALPFICAQLTLHLAYLEHNSIAHRDIKPENILLNNAPEIYGWSIDARHLHKALNNRPRGVELTPDHHCSVQHLSLSGSTARNHVRAMCKLFLPMAHNCECFHTQVEPSTDDYSRPKIVYTATLHKKVARDSDLDTMQPGQVHRQTQPLRCESASAAPLGVFGRNTSADAIDTANAAKRDQEWCDNADSCGSRTRPAGERSAVRHDDGKIATLPPRSDHSLFGSAPAAASGGFTSTNGSSNLPPRANASLKHASRSRHPYLRNIDSGSATKEPQSSRKAHFECAPCLPPLAQQSRGDIARQSKAVPFASLCDFGLSKHMNKAHHSPYIVTSNYRAPELFDPTAFQATPKSTTWQAIGGCNNGATTTGGINANTPNSGAAFVGNQRPTEAALRARLVSSLQFSNNTSTQSTLESITDSNDVSLKREEDLAYDETIDVWGLGCTLAYIVTGRTLFPGRNLHSVYDSLTSLLSSGSGDSTQTSSNSSQQDTKSSAHREPHNSRSCRGPAEDNSDMASAQEEQSSEQTADQFCMSGVAADDERRNEHKPLRAIDRTQELLAFSATSESTSGAINWISSVEVRQKRIKNRIYAHLITRKSRNDNAIVAQNVCETLGDEFFNLLARMLDPNPHTRLRAQQVLQHPFVKPFTECSTLLILSLGLRDLARSPISVLGGGGGVGYGHIQRTLPKYCDMPRPHSNYHWWAFQRGLRAGAFPKDCGRVLEFPSIASIADNSRNVYERRLWTLLAHRRSIFGWCMKIICETKCRYQTLFSALYNFDRCIANFPLDMVPHVEQFQTVQMIGACAIYIAIRYYERVYVSIDTLLFDLTQHSDSSLSVASAADLAQSGQQLQRAMAVFIDSVCGQVTLPSAWHFVLLDFQRLCAQPVDSLSASLSALRRTFAPLNQKTKARYTTPRASLIASNLRRSVSNRRSGICGVGNLWIRCDTPQEYQARTKLLQKNDSALAKRLCRTATQAATATATSVVASTFMTNNFYTSDFKKRCSRLLFLIVRTHQEPYVDHNNRALGALVFRRCLLNTLVIGAFDKLCLQKSNIGGLSVVHVPCVRARHKQC